MQLVALRAGLLLELREARQPFGPIDQRQFQGRLAAGEDAVEPVVILLWDRIVLVIVAAGAGDRQSQEGPRSRLNLLVDGIDLLVRSRT